MSKKSGYSRKDFMASGGTGLIQPGEIAARIEGVVVDGGGEDLAVEPAQEEPVIETIGGLHGTGIRRGMGGWCCLGSWQLSVKLRASRSGGNTVAY